MKLNKLILILGLILFPSLGFAAFTSPWQATSTSQGWIFPVKINGTHPTAVAKNFIASSTSDTSQFLGSLQFDGEIMPDGATCSAGEILKKTGSNDWDCAADNASGGLSGGTTNFLTYWVNSTTIGATSSPTVAYVTATSTSIASTFPYASSTAVSATTFIGALTGNASTASALFANGSNCSAGSFPLGVDASGVVETCTDAWTEAENTSAAYTPQSTTITVAGTANQIQSSAGAQSLAANRTWTLSLPSHVIFPGSINTQNASTTNATTTSLAVLNLTDASCDVKSTTGGSLFCGTDATSAGGGTFPFDPTTNFGTQIANSTSTQLWLQGSPISLSASSTAVFANASTSQLTVFSLFNIGGDAFDELVGTGLQISSGDLQTTLGTSIAAAEIADADHGDFTYASGVATIDANSVALTTDTTGDYVSSATANQGLLLTGTEGASLGLIDCAATEVLKRNAGDTAWECAADETTGGAIDGTGTAGMMTSWVDSNTIQATSTGVFSHFHATSTTNSTFNGALLGDGGDNANPTYSFTDANDDDTGMYLSGSGVLAFAVNGANVLNQNAATLGIEIQGSATAPSLSNNDDSNTGLFFPDDLNTLALTTDGGEKLRLTALGIGIGTTTPAWPLQIASSTAPQLTLTGSATNPHWSFRVMGDTFAIATSSVTTYATSTANVLFFDANGLATMKGLTLNTPLTVANGGTGVATLTDHGVLIGSGTDVITALSVGTNGQLLVGSTGADPVFATLNCAGGLTCTTGAGTLQIDVDDSYLLNNGDVGTGVYDFGGADSFEIPNNGTVNANGEITSDDTSGQLRLFAGSAEQVFHPERFLRFGYATTTWSATTTKLLGPAPRAITVTKAQCETTVGTVNVVLYDGTNRANLLNASTTIGTVTYDANNTFTAGEPMRVDLGTPASSPVQLGCTLTYKITAD